MCCEFIITRNGVTMRGERLNELRAILAPVIHPNYPDPLPDDCCCCPVDFQATAINASMTCQEPFTPDNWEWILSDETPKEKPE
jgi:hypothetical protein